eukprot:10874727-Alexandrium_andersonii.AAC.1
MQSILLRLQGEHNRTYATARLLATPCCGRSRAGEAHLAPSSSAAHWRADVQGAHMLGAQQRWMLFA